MAEQQLGTFGEVTETFSKGVAKATLSAALPPTSFGLKLNVSVDGSLDAKSLIDYLAAKIGGPVPAEVASFIEAALALT